MTQAQRSIAFLATLLLTFGISDFNFEHPEYVNNERAFFVIGAGLVFLILFIVLKVKR